MKANETKVEDFLSSNKTQFVIPVYQRNYDWTIGQCKQLLDDIVEVGTNRKMNAHFIGSIVYIHDDVYTASRIKELTVIDGQQRLTTLTLIYLVLHRLAKELKKEDLANEINETYLINKFGPEEEKLKLRPTDNNDKALKYLLRCDENEEYASFSKLCEVNIFEAEDPTHKKLEYAIFLDKKIEVREVAKLYVEVFKLLFELQPETFINSEIGLRIGLTKNPSEANLRSPMAINDTYFIECGLSNSNKFDKIKYALTVFDLEDELAIKYETSAPNGND